MTGGPPRIARRELPVQGTLTIDVYSDIHVGARGFLEKRFLKDLRETLTDPSRYAAFNGDMFNSEMRDAKHGGIYEEKMNLDDSIDWWEAQLKDHTDKILILLDGNHDKRAWNRAGISPVKQLASRLKIADRYLRDGGYFSTAHGKSATSSHRKGGPIPLTYSCYINHGTGMGPSSTSAERVVIDHEADYYALGHTHTPLATSGVRDKLNAQTDTVTERPWVLGVGGSYLDYDGYPVEQRLRRRPNGRLSFYLDGRERRARVEIPSS